jgi:acetyl esterase
MFPRVILAAGLTLICSIGCQAPALVSTRADTAPAAPVVRVYRDVNETALKAYVFAPDARSAMPRSAVLVFHGGGWVSGSAELGFKAARRFSESGLVAISIEYRLAAGAVSPVEQLSDACEAFRWTRTNASALGIDPAKVVGYGISSGGQLVAAAASLGCGTGEGAFKNGGPDAMVLVSPVVDVTADRHFARLMAGRADPAAYSPRQQVRRRLAPALIVQGELDSVTPLARAQEFCEELRSHGGVCVLHAYPRVGHLLTRNVAGSQLRNIDPDPAAAADSQEAEARFIDRYAK